MPAPGRPIRASRAGPPALARQSLFISALTLLELDSGVARTAKRDKAAGAALRQWIDNQVLGAFDGRILPVDTAIVRRRAQTALSPMRATDCSPRPPWSMD